MEVPVSTVLARFRVPDCVVLAHHLRDNQFCSHSVHARNENGVLHATETSVEKRAKRTDIAENAGPVRRTDGLSDPVDKLVTFGDADACHLVS